MFSLAKHLRVSPIFVLTKSPIWSVEREETLFTWNSLQTRGMQPPGKLKMHFTKIKRKLLFREKVPTLFPDWSILMQMRNQNTMMLVVPKSMVLIGWNLAFWLVSVDANESIATQFPLDGQISAHWSREDTGKSFITVDSDSKSAVWEAEGSVHSFSLQCSVGEWPLSAMAARS